MTHPSFFALDAHALDPRPGEVESHLTTCAQCQTHLAALKTTSPFPSIVLPEPSRERDPWWRFLSLGLATAAVILSIVRFSTRETPQQFTAKGTPAAALWLNRDGKVTVWNGQPIHTGDSVRIEVAPAGFTHVTVFDENTRQVLYEARIPDGPSLTPAWQFDGQAPSESLRVVLSNTPVELQPTCARTTKAHCTQFTLKRE